MKAERRYKINRKHYIKHKYVINCIKCRGAKLKDTLNVVLFTNMIFKM